MHIMTYNPETRMWSMTIQIPHEALVADDVMTKGVMSGYGLVRQLLTMSPETLRQVAIMEIDDQCQHVRGVSDSLRDDGDGTAWPCVVVR